MICRLLRGRQRSGNGPAQVRQRWLSLAAAPTFAIMALLTAVLGGGAPMRCVRRRVTARAE